MKLKWKRTNADEYISTSDQNRQALVDIAVETWRLDQVIDKVKLSMDPITAERFAGQYRWFQKKVDAALAGAGLQIVDLTGQDYSLGMAATALNADEFDDDDLEIAQMIEPVILCEGRVMRTGSVMLRPKESN